MRLGYFGSYAKGDWGVGSDLDLVAIVRESNQEFEYRAVNWDLSELPVQAELLVYTLDEWNRMEKEERRIVRVISREAVWIFGNSRNL